MQLTVIISGEDCYGWEVHWLIRFIPLRVESELANLFSAVIFFFSVSKCECCCLTIVSCKNLQALLHASVDCRRKLVVDWVASTDLEDSTAIEVLHSSLLFNVLSPEVNRIFTWLFLNFLGT